MSCLRIDNLFFKDSYFCSSINKNNNYRHCLSSAAPPFQHTERDIYTRLTVLKVLLHAGPKWNFRTASFIHKTTKKVEITLPVFAFSDPHKIDPLSRPPKKSQVHMDLPEMPCLFHFLLICLKQAEAAAVNV